MISCSHESLQTHENIWLMAWEPSSSALLWGREHGGKEGVGENPRPTRVLVLWAGGHGRLQYAFHATRLDVWLWEATDPARGGGQGAVLGNRFSVLGIPDT